MPYTNDPANSPADCVRLYVGDTNTTAEKLTDSEIDFLLEDAGGHVLRAAARAAEILSAKTSGVAEVKTVGPLTLANRRQSESDRYRLLAKSLWARVAKTDAAPFAGGISYADKITKAEDGDRVHPAFGREMMSYPGGDGVQAATDRDLRP